MGDVYNAKQAKVVMNVFDKVLWRCREESGCICLEKPGTLHREGEAFELGF